MKRAFFDTNIILYTDDKDSPAKQKRAAELIAQHQLAGMAVVSL